MLIVAHRGASADAPENTLAAFRLAFEQHADGIEGDFRLTADGQIVCVHDACFRRFGHPVLIARRTLTDLRAYDIGSWKSPAFAGERVATLAEVMALVPAGKHLRLEIKAGRAPLTAVVAELGRLDVPADRVRLMSFRADVVRTAKRAVPRYPADWLIDFPADHAPPSVETILDTLRKCQADGLGVAARPDVVTPRFGAAVRAAGFAIGAWTVNDLPLARTMAAAGVEAITTDRPGFFKSADFSADNAAPRR